jgi:phospholipid/cholesterol/gamma-HCH transport system permease protein
MSTLVSPAPAGRRPVLLRWLLNALGDLGDLTSFTGRVFAWAVHRPGRGTLLPVFYAVGVRSIPVVAVTGLFIGMVLAVQSYDQFAAMGLQTRLGGVINVSVIRELGPVLAATMLAGRIGSAIAAELATMRITEQIDALSCLGANPIHYLAVPRFLACLTLIPLLTVVANFMGVMGGAVICVWVYHVDAHYYWANTEGYVHLWDIITGLIKPTCFGATIGVIACYRGFTSRAGAEGVGRAATESFVSAFVAILGQDFLLAMFLNQLHDLIWPSAGPKMF